MSAETRQKKASSPSGAEQAHEAMRSMWESGWSRESYEPEWRATDLPAEIDAAVADWFAPKARLLDIGCGDGRISAVLAGRGFDVTGIDFSASAVKRAEKENGPAGTKARFACADICRPESLKDIGGPFNALLDRGCLHGLLKEYYPAYSRNLAALAAPGARFLLLYALHHRATMPEGEENALREETEARLRLTFETDFDWVAVSATTIEKKELRVPALAVRLVRGGGKNDERKIRL